MLLLVSRHVGGGGALVSVRGPDMHVLVQYTYSTWHTIEPLLKTYTIGIYNNDDNKPTFYPLFTFDHLFLLPFLATYFYIFDHLFLPPFFTTLLTTPF